MILPDCAIYYYIIIFATTQYCTTCTILQLLYLSMVQVLLCAYIIPPVYHICTGVRELADASNILVSIVHILYNTAGVYYRI